MKKRSVVKGHNREDQIPTFPGFVRLHYLARFLNKDKKIKRQNISIDLWISYETGKLYKYVSGEWKEVLIVDYDEWVNSYLKTKQADQESKISQLEKEMEQERKQLYKDNQIEKQLG